MTARRVGIAIGGLLVTHNLLRLAAVAMGAPYGIFNYLAFLGWKKSDPNASGFGLLGNVHASPILWLMAAVGIGLTAWAVWHDWQKPPKYEHSYWASALWSGLTAAGFGLVMVLVSTHLEAVYGWALFALLPVMLGAQASILLGRWRRRTVGQSLGVAALSLAVLGLLLLGTAVEGIVCLVMALPLATPLALGGGLIGHAVQRSLAIQHPVALLLLAGIMPFGSTVEHALQPHAEVFMVTTSIELAASPERVWETVLQPASLAAPSQLLFHTGIAYPRASHIEGAGLTATRYCDFSTGKLVEPVLIWDNLHQLRFRVASNPLPMEEWTPYARIHPPHLDGFLVSKQGEYRLTPLPNGGTRLEASTWYQHHLFPAQYWRVWSDYIIHQVHGLVLENIRTRAMLPSDAIHPRD